MKLSTELYGAGILSRSRLISDNNYEYVGAQHKSTRWQKKEHPFMEAFERSEKSTKVSPKGWQALTDVLRVQ